MDVGGSRLGFGFSGTKEVFEEGLQFRSIKIYRADTENRDLFQIILDNVRFPESVLGDIRAQIVACRIGERRLSELLDRYDIDVFWDCVNTIWDQSELLARKDIKNIPSGVYEAAAEFDSDGIELERRVPLRVKVEISGDQMTVDFSKMSDQVQGAINSGFSGAIAAARVAFKSLISRSLRQIKVVSDRSVSLFRLENYSAPSRQQRLEIGAVLCQLSLTSF